MKASQWAEIRRLHEVECFSKRAIAARLRCCHTTVTKALAMDEPPSQVATRRASVTGPYLSGKKASDPISI